MRNERNGAGDRALRDDASTTASHARGQPEALRAERCFRVKAALDASCSFSREAGATGCRSIR